MNKSNIKTHFEKIHGGSFAVGRRKIKRPLSYRKPIDLVLSSQVAKGHLSLKSVRAQAMIHHLVKKQSQRFQVRIESFAIVTNHLQIRLRVHKRENFQNFLRSLSAMLARQITGACRGKPFGKFWDGLALTYLTKPLKVSIAKGISAKSNAEIFELLLQKDPIVELSKKINDS